MANALTTFNDAPQLPAELAAFFEEKSNVKPRETVPTLSYSGKVWTISLKGEKHKLTRKNADGDDEPMGIMRVVVLDYNMNRGRAYYEGAYDPAKPAMPLCWSDDGVAPPDSVEKKQSKTCATCPMAAKGSKVTEQGISVTACAQHRMLVVVPAQKLDYEPLRLKIAMTSDFDGRSPEHQAQGWFAFKNYADYLAANRVNHTAMLVTKMKFDPNVAYPKVLFGKDRWLTPEEMEQVVPAVQNPRVKQLLAGTWTPNGADGTSVVDKEDDEPEGKLDPIAKAKADKAAAKAPVAAAPVAAETDDDDDGEFSLPTEAAAPKPVPAAPVKASTEKIKPAPTKPAANKPKAAAAAPAAASEDLDDTMKDLLSEWA